MRFQQFVDAMFWKLLKFDALNNLPDRWPWWLEENNQTIDSMPYHMSYPIWEFHTHLLLSEWKYDQIYLHPTFNKYVPKQNALLYTPLLPRAKQETIIDTFQI